MDTSQRGRRHLDEGALQAAQGATDASRYSLRKLWRCIASYLHIPGTPRLDDARAGPHAVFLRACGLDLERDALGALIRQRKGDLRPSTSRVGWPRGMCRSRAMSLNRGAFDCPSRSSAPE